MGNQLYWMGESAWNSVTSNLWWLWWCRNGSARFAPPWAVRTRSLFPPQNRSLVATGEVTCDLIYVQVLYIYKWHILCRKETDPNSASRSCLPPFQRCPQCYNCWIVSLDWTKEKDLEYCNRSWCPGHLQPPIITLGINSTNCGTPNLRLSYD